MEKRALVCLLLAAAAILGTGYAAAQGSSDDELTILMVSPGEGETFYVAAEGFMLAIPITGQVVSYLTPLDPETVEVALEFIDSAGDHIQIAAPLDDSGRFEVWASILGPDRPFVSDDPHEIEDCSICHRWDVDLHLPEQIIQLVVHARAEDGRTARAVRRFHLDRGTYRDLVVQVEGIPADAADVRVTATTLIYDWRRRTFYGTLREGQAVVPVEALTYGDLTYEVSLVPHIVAETRYAAPPQSVVVRGGTEAPTTLTLHAEPERASLSGRVVDGLSGEGVEATLLAVNLVTGAAQTTSTEADGTFLFQGLPVAEHALLARSAGGFHLPQRFDLTETLAVETRIHLTRGGGGTLHGVVTLDGEPLPFAQAVVDGLPIAHADPITGVIELDGVDTEGPVHVEITAAGCYGAQFDTADRNLGAISLSLHEETAVIERGGSRLYVPAQSSITDGGEVIHLQHGVLWVRSAATTEEAPPRIQVGEYVLEGPNASFAVERVAGARARLYVSDGEVWVTRGIVDAPLNVGMGQTLVLEGESAIPVSLVPGSGALLRAVAGSVSPFAAAPTASEQFSRAALQITVVAAQGLMLAAYGITFLALPGIAVVVVASYLRRRRSRGAERPHPSE